MVKLYYPFMFDALSENITCTIYSHEACQCFWGWLYAISLYAQFHQECVCAISTEGY